MKMRRFPTLFTRLVMALGVSALAAGSARAADVIESTIPFGFHAGKVDLPAGKYRVAIDWDEWVLTVQDLDSGKIVPVLFVTTLSKEARENSGDARVVFDKTATGPYTLSEVWFPDSDGVLVAATRGEHEHEVIAAKR